MNTTKVGLHLIDTSLPRPKIATSGSLGFDIYARLETEIVGHQTALIPSNLIIECPQDWGLLILPRSSTFARTGLIFPHAVGLIDRDYCGVADEIMIQVYNLQSQTALIKKGQPIAQGLLVRTTAPEFVDLAPGSNSRGGFGSSHA